MIGVWGSPDDTVALFVLRTLRRRSVPAVFLDETALSAADSAAVRVSGRRLALSDLTGLYARPGRPTPSPNWKHSPKGHRFSLSTAPGSAHRAIRGFGSEPRS
jgi:hypothetical protein